MLYDLTFCWIISHAFLSSAKFFQNNLFQRNPSGIPPVSNILDPDPAQAPVNMIWVQTVCKVYQKQKEKIYKQNCLSHLLVKKRNGL